MSDDGVVRLGLLETFRLEHWARLSGWKMMTRRRCTHEHHQIRRGLRVRGNVLYRRGPEEICQSDLWRIWELEKVGLETSTGGRIKS